MSELKKQLEVRFRPILNLISGLSGDNSLKIRKQFCRFGFFTVLMMLTFSLFSTTLAATKKTIIVGGDYDYPPYSFFDKNGDLKGLDIDLIRIIAQKIDVEVEFVFTPWDEAINNLKSGKIDILLAAIYTEDRTKYFDFTIPYNMDYYSIFTREGTGIKKIDDLQGKRVVMLKGDASIEKFLKPLGLVKNISYAPSYPLAFERLINGKYDYILAPFAIASHTLREMEAEGGNINGIHSTKETLLPSLYRMCIKKGNRDLLIQLNDVLDALKTTNEINRLREKWNLERPTSWQAVDVIKYVLIGLIPIAVIVILSLLWSWSLKKQVDRKSKSLREAVKKAELANLSKSRFLANMSHEIRTPLNVISGFSQALIMDNQNKLSEDELVKISNNIYTAGEQLSGIISNVLEISKIEVDRVSLNLEMVNLKKSVQAIYGLSKVRALKQGIIFNYGYDADLPEIIQSDREKINRILNILVGNAIKFTPAGKSIWLKVKKDNNFVEFQLEDQGIGIDEQYLDKIFDPFEQVDYSITTEYGGTGLGLAIAKAYVEQLKGTVTVQSEKGQGSIFTVKLPLLHTESN